MPYVLCHGCAVTVYSAAPWSRAAECPNCAAPLDVPRHGSLEAKVRDALYPPRTQVHRIGQRPHRTGWHGARG